MTLCTTAVQEYVEHHLRPRVQADGGEVRFVSCEDGLLRVRLQGECSRCPISRSCFRDYLLTELHKRFDPNLRLEMIVDRPYFWDTSA